MSLLYEFAVELCCCVGNTSATLMDVPPVISTPQISILNGQPTQSKQPSLDNDWLLIESEPAVSLEEVLAGLKKTAR